MNKTTRQYLSIRTGDSPSVHIMLANLPVLTMGEIDRLIQCNTYQEAIGNKIKWVSQNSNYYRPR